MIVLCLYRKTTYQDEEILYFPLQHIECYFSLFVKNKLVFLSKLNLPLFIFHHHTIYVVILFSRTHSM